MHTNITTPIGYINISFTEKEIHNVSLFTKKATVTNKNALEKDIKEQLTAYFKGELKEFRLPLNIKGTNFQEKIWQALRKISYGKTKTYGQLAKELNTSARAIGNACRENPVPIIIPCHRIIAKNSIGGFAGKTKGYKITAKEWLLQHETTIY